MLRWHGQGQNPGKDGALTVMQWQGSARRNDQARWQTLHNRHILPRFVPVTLGSAAKGWPFFGAARVPFG